MDPYKMPKGFTAHRGRHENRLSRPVMPFGGKLTKFNASQREKGLRELHPTKGWRPYPRKEKPATGHPTKAQELIYAFLGYW